MESLHRERLLQPLQSPVFADLIPEAIRPSKDWIGDRVQSFSSAYNTNAVQELMCRSPIKTFLVRNTKVCSEFEITDLDWFSAVLTSMGEEKGVELFRAIVAKNGISVRRGHTLLTNLVVSRGSADRADGLSLQGSTIREGWSSDQGFDYAAGSRPFPGGRCGS